ncbi:alpha/beta hydrolase [Celerinatantimonas yamalensis]|uniref:Alpha/beta hydrolase n=1 Tax=Celerinatantimonas yamalensis TaxID=559956 RepID=A0ABW9G9G6_9GAMM
MATRSEQLFTRQPAVTETSLSANSAAAQNAPWQQNGLVHQGKQYQQWYRLISRSWWAALGIHPIDASDILAKIAISDAPRTSKLLDTVQGYRLGCWSYEWLRYAVQQASFDRPLIAAMAANVAAYPHFLTDPLVAQAHTLYDHYYRQAMACSPSIAKFECLSVTIEGKTAQGWLHIPRDNEVVPLVVACSDWSQLGCDWWPLYERYLAPAGIALLTISFAGGRGVSAFKWQQHDHALYQQLLEAAQQHPSINTHKIALLGYRFSVPTVVKLAQLNPQSVRTMICLEPVIDRFFVDHTLQHQVPQMIRDGLACFLRSNSVHWDDISDQLKPFSIKTQGLLRRGSWPGDLLSISHKQSLFADIDEIKRLVQVADNGQCIELKGADLSDQLMKVMEKCGCWLQKQLSYE